MTSPTWTISELSKEFELTPRTIRFYEDHGILNPAREGSKRVYVARDRTRLKLALRGKRLGLQLSEIRTLIDMYDGPRDTVPQLLHYLSVLTTQRRTLEQQQQDLEESLHEIITQQAVCETLLNAKNKG
ncbi:MAG: MerR family transcriptional regulator [Alcaligenaceae bacterium]|nr:MAG: MerR family transcriptional regulator [Alcaligenaceae bacterium]